ncbi:MFS transporter [Candidatus Woesearchaeota archaeon]|nr:MFS transporter [Candidatus Woesearchaeota archaeon]
MKVREDKRDLEANIWKYFLYQFLSQWTLFLPFIIFYFLEIGYGLTQIMIFTAGMSLTVFVSEIPTGYIADRIGRKGSIIISAVLLISSTSILFFAESFFLLLLSYVLLGLSDAFVSGADSALIYDTLLSKKREKEYKKIEGRAHFFAEMGVITSSLMGAAVITRGIKWTIAFSLVGYVIMFFVALSFKEPKIYNKIAPLPLKKELLSLGDILKRSLKHKVLLGLFMYMFLVMGTSNVIFTIYQPYFSDASIPLPWYGIIFAVMSVFTGLAALKAHWVEEKLGVRGSLIMIPLILSLSLLGAGFFYAWYGVAFFFLREMVRGFVFPVLGDYTHKIAKSEERATVLSIGSMFSRVGYGLIALAFGVFGDAFGLQPTLLWLGVMVGILFIGVIFFTRNIGAHTTS